MRPLLNNSRQPVAIIGMACRFPGGCNSPDQYWQLLSNGTDAITEIRPDRWSKEYYYHPDPKATGKTYTTAAGQLDDIYHFDPEFFGISPREAAQMDPQQRLLLQMAWEAMEDGGARPRDLAGSDTSVYIGVSSLDYANNRMDDPNVADAYFMTGNTLSIAANRLSYIFDLHGPSMTIDTACSSSLVALHQACSSIWSGESSASIVGAVHLVLSPFPFIGFSKASMLSRQGRCSVFDAGADGYVRSEGGVVLYLKALDQALQDKDRIHAVIRGTAVNSDGNTSAMTVPNGAAQAALLEKLYRKTGIDINHIDYIEAHGTGTPVGDPIETSALGQAIGVKRSSTNPLLIGSVKTNIGHLEPASGFAGLLKVVLSLKHRAVPATIHQHRQNPQIDFNGLNIRVVDNYTGLAVADRPLIMGVNSFGFGGTNAHTIVEEYRHPLNIEPTEITTPDVLPPLYLSSRSEDSLKQRASQFRTLLDQDLTTAQIYDLFYTAACKRQRLKYGLVVQGASIDKIQQALTDFTNGKKSAGFSRVEVLEPEGGIAWVFSGNGCQWPGMGRSLLVNDLFRKTIEQIDLKFKPLAGWSLLDELTTDPDSSRLELTEIAQPLLFAVQVGIVELLHASGVHADAVVGHSVGEIAGAYVSGALTLDDAIRVIYFRSMAQGRTRGRGRMAAVRLAPATIQPILDGYDGELEIAAVNTIDSVTISGSRDAIRSLMDLLQEQSVSCRELDLDYAFHSNVMDDIEPYITTNLSRITPLPSRIRFVSTVTGSTINSEKLDAEYWWKNIREPVRFGDAVAGLFDSGIRTYIEVGAHPVLQSYLRETLSDKLSQCRILRTLKRNDADELLSLQSAAYKVLFSRASSSLDKVFPVSGQIVSLPPYPWNNALYIFAGSNEAINKQREHPLLGFRLNAVDGIWLNQIDLLSHPYLADHVVDGLVIFPAAGFAEMALAASHSWFGRDISAISGLEIRKPMILEPGKTRVIQFQLSTRDLQFTIRSRDRLGDSPWTEHATGRLIHGVIGGHKKRPGPDKTTTLPAAIFNSDLIYSFAALCRLEYGRRFRGATKVVIDADISYTELMLPEETLYQQSDYLCHPVLMDSAFHSMFVQLPGRLGDSGGTDAFVPVEMNEIRFYGRNAGSITSSKCVLHSASRNMVRASFVYYNGNGLAVAEISECTFRKIPRQERANSIPAYYEYRVIPKNLISATASTPLPRTQEIVADLANLPDRLALVANEKLLNEQIIPLFDALAAAIAEHTMRNFGAHLGHFTLDSLITASRINPDFRSYLAYLLNMLEQDGKAVCHDGQWKLLDSEEIDDPVAIWRSILADYPAQIGALRYTANNSFRIREILTGDQGFNTRAEDVSPACITTSAPDCLQQRLLRHVLDGIRRDWPRGVRRLRIAEIGCGHSEVAREIMHSLPPDFCDYEILATDEASAARAEELYRNAANVSVARFDPSRSGYRAGEFDIVLVLGDLHSYQSLSEMFIQIAALLASDGMLLLLEKRPDRITDMNMGLLNPGWWHRSTDEDRPLSSNLLPDDWIYLLENSGFEEVRNLSESLAGPGNRYLLSARRPARQVKEAVKRAEQSSTLLLASADGYSFELAKSVKAELSQNGVQTTMAVDPGRNAHSTPGQTILDLLNNPDIEQLQGMLDLHNTLPLKIVYLVSLNEKTGELSSADTVAERISASNMRLLNLIKLLTTVEMKSRPVIWIVTAGAVSGIAAGSVTEPNPYQSGIWGLGRVIRNEYPDIDCRMIDLQTTNRVKPVARLLVQEITAGDGEEEVVLSNNARSVLRLDRFDPDTASSQGLIDSVLPDSAGSSHLAFSRAGSIDNLEWQAHERRLPRPEEVEIEVRATGLNFRDIMFTSGLLPGEMLEGGHSGATLGLECSGIVSRIGEGVRSFSVGDEVIAMASACFAKHVIVSKYSVIRKIPAWSFEAAATIPTAFFTVYYALNHLARLKPGEKILIHGAAGGIGLAAIQYARYCGAEIFVTAGTAEKRNFLRLLGAEHVLDSRTLEFADEIKTITSGTGVDVVLNALAGEAMARNFSVIRPFGRFIELGKRDFFENTKMDLKPFRNNITYFGVDADQLLSHAPELSRRLMNEVMQLFNEGVFRPLPYTAFTDTDVHSAFRYMQQSRHIGKVVVTRTAENHQVKANHQHEIPDLNPDATYLVTGGLSGLGLATTQWLVKKGARHLVLVGRSGIQNGAARNIIDDLLGQDVDVKAVECDVTDAIRTQSVLNEIQNSPFPLKGIVHAAMVLDDASIRNMDHSMMHKVITPKVQGAWNLHRLTLNYPLDMFILYSSATTAIGNPGQANYVSANTFLESLARFRAHSGLPATVVALDAITDTGYLARNEQLAGKISRRMGLAGITSVQALSALEQLLVSGRTEAIIMNANWAALRKLLPVLNSNLYRNIMHSVNVEGELGSDDLAEVLSRLPDDEKQPLIVSFLIREIARILQTAEEKIAHNCTIQDLGVDSLMAMELASTIESRLGVDLPVMTLADNVTIDNLSLRIVSLLGPQPGNDSSDLTHIVSSLVKIHAEDMTADEIDTFSRAIGSEEHKTIRLIK